MGAERFINELKILFQFQVFSIVTRRAEYQLLRLNTFLL